MSSLGMFRLLAGLLVALSAGADAYSEEEAQEYLDNYNPRAQFFISEFALAGWDYSTNITHHNLEIVIFVTVGEHAFGSNLNSVGQTDYECVALYEVEGEEYAEFAAVAAEEANKFTPYLNDYTELVARELEFITDIGDAILDDDDFAHSLFSFNFQPTKGDMWGRFWNNLYSIVEPYPNGTNVDVTDEMIRQVGKKAPIVFHGYPDYGAYWRANYEDENLEEDMWHMYADIKPLYEKLHAYVRYRLKEVYGDKINLDKGCLPANVLGDMWGRFWNNLYSIVEPYPNGTNVDVTDEMIRQNYTVDRMFRMADDFFISMGMIEAPPEFWAESMFVKPTDRLVECHATAWDFYNQIDFRIRMCTEVNMDDFMTIHHEMGHIQYYLQYKHQPVEFRDGANEGFHEAVGEVIAMSAATTQHLYTIGLLHENPDDYASDINFLMKQSLTMVATLPFSIALEKWRWEVFRYNIPYEDWMKKWWEIK
uniref:Angiotensin-converting enzyme n=1 Tax=Saccoglossus kowalevskii TaxID=10224 RepID=A0ABM0MBD1_SACKO|nr:PREDICTED: angiotensin-converting enzyme-like [Saccoglossus kowalevskii]